MPTIVGILTFVSMINFSWVEHENIFISLGLDFPVLRIGYVLVIALHQAALEKLIIPNISFLPCLPVNLGPEVIKLFSCSTQLSTKLQLLIKTKILTNKEVSCFKSFRTRLQNARMLNIWLNIKNKSCRKRIKKRGMSCNRLCIPTFVV